MLHSPVGDKEWRASRSAKPRRRYDWTENFPGNWHVFQLGPRNLPAFSRPGRTRLSSRLIARQMMEVRITASRTAPAGLVRQEPGIEFCQINNAATRRARRTGHIAPAGAIRGA